MVLLFSSRDMELFRKRLSVYGSYCPSALERLWVLSMVGLDKLIWVTVVGLAGTKGIESKGWEFMFVQILDGDEEETARYQPFPSSPTSLSCLFSKRWSHQHLSYTPRAKNKGGEVGQFQSRALGLSFPTWHVQTGSCHLPGMS